MNELRISSKHVVAGSVITLLGVALVLVHVDNFYLSMLMKSTGSAVIGVTSVLGGALVSVIYESAHMINKK